MRDALTVTAYLTPGGLLTIAGDLLEDLAADTLLPRPEDPGDVHRPVAARVPVRITVEPLTS